jgi:hypothetical protein
MIRLAVIEKGEDESNTFLARINEDFINQIDTSRSEFIFLFDRSRSMSGQPIQNAVDTLALFLKSLPNDSYFNVINFGSSFSPLFNTSQNTQANPFKKPLKKSRDILLI